ncbi:putative iron-regulated membrane protein [Pseudobacter ginsenosidimutans]|uniref:Putative iron-regulated membrane protein n=2 Tax=Pseudobacter ginsenosidimutans TaxID=661488 RepID=A0A4Q7MR40_9BACT|nr:PepSY domain-containing protein [Pseudobacter ginsenosidimutans]RZS69219.1 putative iron-regulated membrane protein [Pseudobacter ginsenosidimutans]
MTKKKKGWALHQKRWFGKWHLYLGIIAGAILVVVGLTGSILVFQDEIDIALNKDLFESMKGQKRYSIEEVVPVVQQKYPTKEFDYVMYADVKNPNATYRFFNFHTEEEFFINPYTAELSGKRLVNSSFIRIVMNIHRTLLVPVAGRYIVGFATLCMLILTISGLRLWVPQQYKKWKQWKAVLTVNFRASFKRQNYDWHNVIGFYTAPIVILLSITGIAITFSTLFIGSLFMITGQSPQSVASIFGQKSVVVEGAKTLTLAEVSAIAHQQMPTAVLIGAAIPDEKDGVYRLDMKSPGASKEGNRVMMMVDQYSGKITLNSETDFPNIGNSYLSWLTPLHYGTFGGMPTRILALIGGLVPLLLFITGFIIWWPRYKKQKGKATYVEPKPTVKERELESIRQLPFGKYFVHHFKKGLKYALLLLVCAFLSGALYGLISGVIIQPALFTVLYTGISIGVNFVIAFFAFTFTGVFLAPFRKGSKPVYKYFALSLAFLVVFLPVIVAMGKWCTDLF